MLSRSLKLVMGVALVAGGLLVGGCVSGAHDGHAKHHYEPMNEIDGVLQGPS